MGTWGYHLYEDDSFCEVMEEFQKRMGEGGSAQQVASEILQEYENAVDEPIARLAVAESLWRLDQLSENQIASVKRMIDDGIDSGYWKELGADEKFLQGRSAELRKFLARISEPPTKKEKWKLSLPEKKPQKGDCFWYKFHGALYGAVVLEIQTCSTDSYLIAISDALDAIPKSVEQVLSAGLYTAAWFAEIELLSAKRMHTVGTVNMKKDYTNHYGIRTETDEYYYCSNCGQRDTWAHSYRALAFRDALVRDIVR